MSRPRKKPLPRDPKAIAPPIPIRMPMALHHQIERVSEKIAVRKIRKWSCGWKPASQRPLNKTRPCVGGLIGGSGRRRNWVCQRCRIPNIHERKSTWQSNRIPPGQQAEKRPISPVAKHLSRPRHQRRVGRQGQLHGRLVGRAIPDQVKPFWEFQGQMFEELDEAFRQMTALETTKAKAKAIAAKLRKRIPIKVAQFRMELANVLAERKAAEAELRSIALEQFPDLDEKDFIIVGNGVLCAGEPEGDHVTNGHTEPPKKKNEFDFDPGRDSADDDDDNDGISNNHFPSDPVNILDPNYQSPMLPHDILPKPIEDYAFVRADLMGVDPGGVAMAALAVAAGVLSDYIKLKMKRHDDWMESARIWVALVGDPSSKKSPIISAVKKPVSRLDAALAAVFAEEMDEWESLSDEEKAEKPKPQKLRYISSDTTIEALQNTLRYNRKAVVIIDELSGLFGSMDKYSGSKGAAKDRANWLELYNGGPTEVDRVTRGSFNIPNWSGVLVGGIQPTVLQKVSNDNVDDGMLQRVNPVIMRDAGAGKDVPAPGVVEEFDDLIETLSKLEPPEPESEFQKLGDDRRYLRFDREAQELRNQLEAKHLELIKLQTISKKLAGHVGKLDGMFGRYCVLFHCIEHAHDKALPSVVTIDTAKRVADFMHKFLLPHAMAFYLGILGMGEHHDELKTLAGYVLAHKKPKITYRDTQRASQNLKKLTNREFHQITESMESLGWLLPIREINRKTGMSGQRILYWAVNPAVHRLFSEQAKTQQREREKARSIILSQVANTRKGPAYD